MHVPSVGPSYSTAPRSTTISHRGRPLPTPSHQIALPNTPSHQQLLRSPVRSVVVDLAMNL